MKRIGFACHYVINDGLEKRKGYESFRKPFVMKATTRAYINKQTPEDGFKRLVECMENNTNVIHHLVKSLSQLPENVRMLRISSDVFPLYTAPDPIPQEFYSSKLFKYHASKRLMEIGDLARKYNVRLSFHPSQFVVLGSPLDYVVDGAIDTIEYHTELAKMMGYAKDYNDIKCNIHLSGNAGLKPFLRNYYRLSPEARKILTVENTEFGLGSIENCLKIRKHVPIVLDIHHHWIHSRGEYLNPKDRRVKLIETSWAKSEVRPTMHFSWIKECACYGMDENRLPRFEYLNKKHNLNVLRSHALTFYNLAARDWALGFLDRFDIMCEAKAKNIASYELYNYALENNFI